jgi:NAD(P)-dependent dehydrogenase (short-subunit alcohol dehydrogenase family)
MRLRDKVCLISGGAKGLGAAQARILAQEGGLVAIGDLLEKKSSELVNEISIGCPNAISLRLDVTSEKDWTEVIDSVIEKFGRLDVLVNNAGIYQRATVDETTADDWDNLMNVNARGVFLGTRAAIPVMKHNGSGSIINISSIAGLVGSMTQAAYNASKGAVRLLTKATAIQYAKDGIRANSIHPGLMETDMLTQVLPSTNDREHRLEITPIPRFGTPADVAYGVVFLASDESSYVTGTELVIDGGLTAQ